MAVSLGKALYILPSNEGVGLKTLFQPWHFLKSHRKWEENSNVEARGRREGGSGWGTHVNPWLIHVNVWQKPLQYCKVISLQLIKINGKNKNK